MSQQPVPDETILGLLAAQPRHGYELLEFFRDPAQLGQIWTLSTSQLYAVLKRLEGQGLTAGREIQSPDAPPRIQYSVTRSGLDRLNEWLSDPNPSASIRRVRVEFLSRLYVARMLKRPVRKIIDTQISVCRQKHTWSLAMRDRSNTEISALALELIISQQSAVLEWLEGLVLDGEATG